MDPVPDDVSGSRWLLESLWSLASRLAQHSYAVYELKVHFLVFGSWLLVAGFRQRRAQVVWDGKDFVLTCAVSEFPNASSAAHWQPVGSQSLPPPTHTRVFAVAEQLLLEALGA